MRVHKHGHHGFKENNVEKGCVGLLKYKAPVPPLSRRGEGHGELGARHAPDIPVPAAASPQPRHPLVANSTERTPATPFQCAAPRPLISLPPRASSYFVSAPPPATAAV